MARFKDKGGCLVLMIAFPFIILKHIFLFFYTLRP